MLCLIFVKVVLQSKIESFGVFRCHDYPAADFRLGKSRKHGGEVNDELAVRMGDDCKIGVC